MTHEFLIRLFHLEEVDDSFPSDWSEQIRSVASAYSLRTVLDGSSETSREENRVAIEVYVAGGTVVQRYLPWLDKLYRTTFLTLASATTGTRMTTSEDLRNGVNINSIRGRGARYEKHVDSNPLTGALFVSDHSLDEGGALEFEVAGSKRHVEPREGLLVLFDGRDTPHTVTPLRRDATRISVLMNFFFYGQRQERPVDLDEYLYESSAAPPEETSDG